MDAESKISGKTPVTRLQELKSEITEICKSTNRDPSEIKVLLATKTQNPETLKELVKAGYSLFGENKVQEFLSKYQELKDHTITWHFIGHLQTNKAKDIVGKIKLLHSLDSLKLADKLNSLLTENLDLLIQVNVSGEKSKYGFKPEDVPAALKHIKENCPHLTPKGFMTMAPIGAPTRNNETARDCFKKLKQLSVTHNLHELSIGMSNDYRVAIDEGATLLRLGSKIFGPKT